MDQEPRTTQATGLRTSGAHMKNMISLVGRPNVGKSSLFNALLKRKQALVMDVEGVTRDRRFGTVAVDELGGREVKICDTGGWMPETWRKGREDKELLQNIEKQIVMALKESAVIVLVMDIRKGVTNLDEDIVKYIRKLGIPFVIAANKADVPKQTFQISEFYTLGAEEVIPLSAEHKMGLVDFWEAMDKYIPKDSVVEKPDEDIIKVCIVGRPNVGKSSLLNQLVGEERSVASSMPGTTTDPVDVDIERAGKKIRLVDTAGIRRGAKRKDDVEDLAVMYAKRNLEASDLAFLMVDAEEGITSQDSRIANLVEDSGCAVIILVNKWDRAPHGLKSDADESMKKFREIIDKSWPFLDFAPMVAISAEKGKVYGAAPGIDIEDSEEAWNLPKTLEDLWAFALEMIAGRERKVSTEELKEVLEEAFAVGPNWIEHIGEFRRAHQVGHRPPQFLVFVRDANKVPEALRRYLKRTIRERFGFRGNPIRWVFRHRQAQQ